MDFRWRIIATAKEEIDLMDTVDINDNKILMCCLSKRTPQTRDMAKLNILLQVPGERSCFEKFAIPFLTKDILLLMRKHPETRNRPRSNGEGLFDVGG